jgi:threonine aldolase
MQRRSFLAVPLAFQSASAQQQPPRVFAYGDGIPHTPQEYSALLGILTKPDDFEADDFSSGGVVAKLESRMAALLGKEAAVWLPTGTLANHLAVRILAGNNRRVLVQAESHLFNDSGDCAQTLSGLHLVPLAAGRAGFSLQDCERAAADSQLGRVATPVGAVSVETPVRRRSGERFDFDEMKKIAAWARGRRIGLHLDGARLFVESVYATRPVKEYAALFDTVYISMYKCFNAASGAILAGPKALLADLHHTRRMFGGALAHAWPSAAVALRYFDGFEQRLRAGMEASETVIKTLFSDPGFEIERVPNGTNIFRLRVNGVNAPIYQTRLQLAGIEAEIPTGTSVELRVNETWARVPVAELIARFRTALG